MPISASTSMDVSLSINLQYTLSISTISKSTKVYL